MFRPQTLQEKCANIKISDMYKCTKTSKCATRKVYHQVKALIVISLITCDT